MKTRYLSVRSLLFAIGLIIVVVSLQGIASSEEDEHGDSQRLFATSMAINPHTDVVVTVMGREDDEDDFRSGHAVVTDICSGTVTAEIPVGREPWEVAIDHGLNLALVCNKKDKSISIVDLGTLSRSATISLNKEPDRIAINQVSHEAIVTAPDSSKVMIVNLMTRKVTDTVTSGGEEPIDVAIDPQLNLGLIVSQEDHKISVLDLDSLRLVRTMPLGKKPSAIDINPEAHIAAVVDEKDDSLTLIDLHTWQTTTIPVRKHPTSVVLNPLDNRALVICDKGKALDLIDIDRKTTIKSYPLNRKAGRVAVHRFSNAAIVMEEKTGVITLIQLPNPISVITNISPESIVRGVGDLALSIEGSALIRSSMVYLDNLPLSTTFTDNHHVQATIPREKISKAGAFPLTIVNPAPEGGVSNTATVTVNNPIPSISTIDPAEVMAGTTGITLNVLGSGFFEDTEVYFAGVQRAVSFVNSTKLQVGLTTEDLRTPGKYEVITHNLPPGGGNSNPLTFTVENSLGLAITSPGNGETINKRKTMVKGTFSSGTQDVGITVNGVVADLRGNEWTVNDVPLEVGSNILTATIKDNEGKTASASATVLTGSAAQAIKLSANITSGIPPLTTSFSLSTEISNMIATYQIDFEGDGIIDYTGTTFENTSHTYTTGGVYFPAITVTDDAGNIYSDTIAITVLNKTEIDALLKGKWEKAKAALVKGDIEGALRLFMERSKERYRSIFSVLKDQLPVILGTFIEFNIINVYEIIAEYEIIANENGTLYSYPGVFIKSGDGMWKFKDL